VSMSDVRPPSASDAGTKVARPALEVTRPTKRVRSAATKPDAYRRVIANRYALFPRPRPLRRDETFVCTCPPQGSCDDACINRIMLIECDKRTCPCGDRCTNQRMQRRQVAPTKLFRTPDGRGWGVAVTQDVSTGDLIGEYCGEVIDDAESRRRLHEAQCTGEDNFYIFHINNTMVIDARAYGSTTRFINHSCDPNCVAQKWCVQPR